MASQFDDQLNKLIDQLGVARDGYQNLMAENERLRVGLQRLSSPEPFETSRRATHEETERMKYAAAVLDGTR